jgi:hypothetical protein
LFEHRWEARREGTAYFNLIIYFYLIIKKNIFFNNLIILKFGKTHQGLGSSVGTGSPLTSASWNLKVE